MLCLIFIERWDKEHDFLDPSFVFLLRRETLVNIITITAVNTGPKNNDSNTKQTLLECSVCARLV